MTLMLDFEFSTPTPRNTRPTRPRPQVSEPALVETAPTVTIVEPAPTLVTVTETVTAVVSRMDSHSTHLNKDESSWGWEELRDFVVNEIESRQGPIPRDSRKESGIFKSFLTRYGVTDASGKVTDASRPVAIAKAAFGPVFNGMWNSAPIGVNRFCKGSDVYFADVIAKRL